MKRLLPLVLVLFAVGGCGQSEESNTASTQAPTPAAPTTQETAAASPVTAGNQTSTPAAAATRTEVAQAEVVEVDLSAVEAAGFIEGQHYRRLLPAQPTNSPAGQVEVNEFFMHSCIHCYNLEPYVEAWLEDKPDFVNFVRVPTTWDAYRQLHAQAFYTAEALGVIDELMMPWFQEIHLKGDPIETPAKLANLFGSVGVSKDDFDGVFESFAVMTKVNRASELGRRFRVDSTPTIIIGGKYTTGVGMADPVGQNPEVMFELIEALAAAELGR